MTTPNPTPTEKDLQMAREFLFKQNEIWRRLYPDEITKTIAPLLSEYVLDLEAKGIIKFTANRYDRECLAKFKPGILVINRNEK